MDPMSAFTIGKSLRKNPLASAVGGAMEDFKKKKELEDKLGLEVAKANIISPVDQSTIFKNYATGNKAMESGGSRGVFLVNRRTGKIHKAGDKTMAEVNPEQVGQTDRIMSVDIPPASASQMFTQSEASVNQIDNLINIIRNKNTNKFIGGFTGIAEPLIGTQNQETQKYNVIRKDFSDRLLRLRSGAQINEQEYNRLMGMLPQWWRNSEVDIQQLNKFKKEYQNLMSRLSGGELGNVNNREDVSEDASTTSPSMEDDVEAKKSRLRSRYYGK